MGASAAGQASTHAAAADHRRGDNGRAMPNSLGLAPLTALLGLVLRCLTQTVYSQAARQP